MNRHKDINIFVSGHQPCIFRVSLGFLIMPGLAFHVFLVVSVFADLGKAVHRRLKMPENPYQPTSWAYVSVSLWSPKMRWVFSLHLLDGSSFQQSFFESGCQVWQYKEPFKNVWKLCNCFLAVSKRQLWRWLQFDIQCAGLWCIWEELFKVFCQSYCFIYFISGK